MKETLLRALIEQNYFRVQTEVDIKHTVPSVGYLNSSSVGTFTVTRIAQKRASKELFMEGIATGEKSAPVRFGTNDIIAIDGMTPERFGENYMLDAEGNKISVGKRRGRRPKGWTGEEE